MIAHNGLKLKDNKLLYYYHNCDLPCIFYVFMYILDQLSKKSIQGEHIYLKIIFHRIFLCANNEVFLKIN